jgi:flagellar basal body-associated protein FliL
MSSNESLARRRSSVQVPALTEKMLIAIILLLFVLLHGLAGAILQHGQAADGARPEPAATLQLYD